MGEVCEFYSDNINKVFEDFYQTGKLDAKNLKIVLDEIVKTPLVVEKIKSTLESWFGVTSREDIQTFMSLMWAVYKTRFNYYGLVNNMDAIVKQNQNKMVFIYYPKSDTVSAFAPGTVWYKYIWYFSLWLFSWEPFTDDTVDFNHQKPDTIVKPWFWKDTIFYNASWKEPAVIFSQSELSTLRASIETEKCKYILNKSIFVPRDLQALITLNKHKGSISTTSSNTEVVSLDEMKEIIQQRLYKGINIWNINDYYILLEMLEYIDFFAWNLVPWGDSIKKWLQSEDWFKKIGIGIAKLSIDWAKIEIYVRSWSKKPVKILSSDGEVK